MILWRAALLFRVQRYSNALQFPTGGNTVKIKYPLHFRYLGKDWKVILESQLLQDLADKQNSGFPFKNKQAKANQPTKTNHEVGFTVARPFWQHEEWGQCLFRPTFRKCHYVCSLRKKRTHLLSIGLPITNVRYTNIHILAKCFPILNGQLESYAKFSP